MEDCDNCEGTGKIFSFECGDGCCSYYIDCEDCGGSGINPRSTGRGTKVAFDFLARKLSRKNLK